MSILINKDKLTTNIALFLDDQDHSQGNAVIAGNLVAWLVEQTLESYEPAAPGKVKKESQARAARWARALAQMTDGVGRIQEGVETLREGSEVVRELHGEYSDWKDNLPEGLAQSPVGEKLEAVADLDIDTLTGFADDLDSTIGDIESTISEFENLDLPLGFGRD